MPVNHVYIVNILGPCTFMCVTIHLHTPSEWHQHCWNAVASLVQLSVLTRAAAFKGGREAEPFLTHPAPRDESSVIIIVRSIDRR